MKITHIDYKKELEAASKGMIMIHEPELLIRLIVRMIVRKVEIKHAGMILFDTRRNSYVLTISKGETGVKVPAGYARLTRESPLIKLFTHKAYRPLTLNKSAIISQDINKMIWQESVISNGNGIKELLHHVGDQMQMFNAVACVPAYYRDKLLAILLLGEKNDGTKFEQEELDFFSALAHDVAMAIRNAQLFNNLKKEAQKNKDLFLRTTIVLGSTIEAKDKYTSGHTERVTQYSLTIARQMLANGSANFPESFFDNLYISGMLHDIGKIGIPETILNKNGPLTQEEMEIMKRHTIHGVEILAPLSELKESLSGVRSHHERYDGNGYPDHLKGEDIPMIAAIIAVADSYDAMTTDRPYRKGLSSAQAIEEIKKQIGKQFNPKPARAMVELFEMAKI
ncbi:MAG: HD domain-containing protein [Candidatus Omnitrophota bacterium]|nr:HD domain-containing protein [Candidatus Omnitrophota bacterium]